MKKLLIILPALLLLIGAIVGYSIYRYVKMPYSGEAKRIYISRDISEEQLNDILTDSLGRDFANHVMKIWRHKDGDVTKASGSYIIKPNETAMGVAARLRSGSQNPVRVVIGGHRTFGELIDQLSSQLDFTSEEFLTVCDSILPARGFDTEAYEAAIIPDTYEFYWNVTPQKALERLLGYRDDFWNDDRLARAKKLGLTPIEIATLASIVEEETAKTDERPTVARLYLNRLARGMKLQADPTVKYAVGDPTLRRVLNKHLETQSPYNTYLVAGLPPGPIRIPEKSTLNAVLNAPENNYLYMCAKEDFSGYHNFARDLATHSANARRYQAALNRLNIK